MKGRVDTPEEKGFRLTFDGARNIFREFFLSGFHLVLLLWAAGRRDWINAWVCIGLAVSYQIISAAVLLKFNPGLINRRGKVIQPGTKGFDRVFVAVYMPLSVAISILCGLDAVRFSWSEMPLWLCGAGVIIFIVSCAFGLWAMAVNKSFDTTVVIRTDGTQEVASSGPYRWVRHPGYLAAAVGAASYPLILGSWWGLAAAALLITVFAVRTHKEDRALMEELPGYREYARSIRWRLLPFVW